MPLSIMCVAGLSSFFFYKAIDEGQNLKPPYDHNYYLGGISSFVATMWAIRLYRWVKEPPAWTEHEKESCIIDVDSSAHKLLVKDIES
jgi:hypothetical protein